MPRTKSLEGLTILTNEGVDPDLVLRIEQEVLVGEPSETREGIEFLLKHGVVLVLKGEKDGLEIEGIAESIKLSALLDINKLREALSSLPLQSPLRMILEHDEQYSVLRSIRDVYPKNNDYHYAHGIAINPKGLGYGTALFAERIKRLIGEDDLMFGFVRASPPNIPSIRMYLKKEAVIDDIVNNVYEPNATYFRIVYSRTIKSNPENQQMAALRNSELLKNLFMAGYVGVGVEASNILVLSKRL